MQAIRRIRACGNLKVTGLHTHIGTYILSPDAYRKAANKLSSLADQMDRETGMEVSYIDLGGGIASSSTLHEQYSPGRDSTPSLEEYAEVISRAFLEAGFAPNRLPTLTLETGRALVDEAGSIITRAITNKRLSDGTRALVVDAGVNSLFTSFWYRHDVFPVTDRGGMTEETVIYGPLCMNIDVIRPSILLPPIEPDDALVIRPVGAYNVTQWMQFIQLRPPIVLIGENGSVDLIRRSETIHDIKGPESLPKRFTTNM